MRHDEAPAAPPRPIAALQEHTSGRTPGFVATLLNRSAGRMRALFDRLEFSLDQRPRLRAGMRILHRLLRIVAAPIPHVTEPTELEEVRKLGLASRAVPGGPNIVVMSFRGWTTHTVFELLVGHALQRRGASPTYVVCGGGLPRTELGRPRAEFPAPCAACRSYVMGVLDAGALPYVLIDQLVNDRERNQIADLVAAAEDLDSYEIEGIRPAEHAVRSTLWVARSGLAARELHKLVEFREFVESAAITARAFARFLDQQRPDAVVMVSGLFFAESVMRALAQQRGIRVVTYDFPGRPGTVFISAGLPATFFDIRDLWDARGAAPPTPAERERIQKDIAARVRGSDELWPAFGTSGSLAPTVPGLTRLTAFTNVSWDTAVTLRDLGFDDMFDWLERVVAWAISRPDVHLDVRAHPAETQMRGWESKDLAIDFLSERFPDLPSNVHLHGPESMVDSYALIQESAAVLVYTSTIGLEAALLGRPVLVAADVHYRGKGFTYDINGPHDLLELLARPEELTLTPEQYDLALSYANVFFYESMIELRTLTERWRGRPTLRLVSSEELDDDPAIQTICNLALDEVPAT